MPLKPPEEPQKRDEHSATEPQPKQSGTLFPRRWFPFFVSARTFSVPEGRRRRLAGGKSATADAAPGIRREWLRAPAGHRRNGPDAGRSPAWLWSDVGCPTCGRRRAVTEMLRGWRRQKLLRCPAGAWPVRRGNRGPRPLARACPRLISCGVPPGREAERRRGFSGGLIAAGATAKSSRRAKISPGARLCAWSTSRSGLAPGDAADANWCWRGFRAAAAGPRRTQPRSLGCGSAALCSSRLCGSSRSSPSHNYAVASRLPSTRS